MHNIGIRGVGGGARAIMEAPCMLPRSTQPIMDRTIPDFRLMAVAVQRLAVMHAVQAAVQVRVVQVRVVQVRVWEVRQVVR